jgi:hypothetical protein
VVLSKQQEILKKGGKLFFTILNKIMPIFRVYILAVVGVFAVFIYLLSFKPAYILLGSGQIPDTALFSGATTFFISGYFWLRKNKVSSEYASLKNQYLQWIEFQQGKKVFWNTISVPFLVSVPMNLSISLCQFGLIEIFVHFTNCSIPSASNISLLIVNSVNFFIFRTYLFRFKEKNYLHQVSFYIFFTAIGLFVNYWSVEWINNNLISWKNSYPVVFFISNVVGDKSTPQFIASIFLGSIWFRCHYTITFTTKSFRSLLKTLLGFF